VTRLPTQCGILNVSQPYRPPRSVMGIGLAYVVKMSAKPLRQLYQHIGRACSCHCRRAQNGRVKREQVAGHIIRRSYHNSVCQFVSETNFAPCEWPLSKPEKAQLLRSHVTATPKDEMRCCQFVHLHRCSLQNITTPLSNYHIQCSIKSKAIPLRGREEL
jgi:hypothetical protein